MRTGPIEPYRKEFEALLAQGITPKDLKQMLAEKIHLLVTAFNRNLMTDPEIQKLWAVREILLECYPELKEQEDDRP